MKELFRKLTAVFLSASLLMINAGAEGMQNEADPAAAALTKQETEESDDTGELLTDITEPAGTLASEPENISDEELRRSIEKKTQEAIASSNGVISFSVELTPEEIEYIERTTDAADSEGNRSVYSPVNLGGSLSEYANDYFLNKMTTAERALYTNLFNVCTDFSVSTSDVTTDNIGVYAYYDPSQISESRLRTVYNLFYYSNPQFYFLRNGYSYNSTQGRITPSIYTDFRYATTRGIYSTEIAAETEKILPGIKAEKTELAKERAIYKYISSNTTYQDTDYDQSIASVLVDRFSVCNGYALTAEYLCNAVDLDCIVVVGQNHAWNIINLGGVWYELDVTWMDQDDGERMNFKWRNKSYDTFLANDSNRYHEYTSRLEYDHFTLPVCTTDMHLEDENYVIDGNGQFYRYTGDLTELIIPDDIGIRTIAYPALYNNTFVTSVIIPKGITAIGDSAFASSTALLSVSIPNSVEAIGVQAFYNSSITDIYYAGTAEQWAAINIGRSAIPANCTIHYNSQPPVSGVEITPDNFPDKLFRRFVSDNFDLNKDSVLSDDEISAVTEINVNYWGIIYPTYGSGKLWSLEGIEHFTKLKSLNLSGNNVSELDLSSNTALTTLNCSANNLEVLDLSKNTALLNVSCGSNRLTALDVTANTSLVGLNCNDNSYDIGQVRDTFSLSGLPYLDPTRASEWTGAEYSEDDNALKNITGTSISYSYSCGNGFKKTFTLTFSKIDPQPVSIAVTAPTKTVYFIGEEVDPTGGIVTVSYDFGAPVNIAMTADMLSGYDISKTGTQTVTVTYEGFTDTFTITYKTPSITGITVTAPTKTTYFVGEAVVPDGGIVTVSYDFGAPVNIAMTADMLSGYDNTTAGKQNVTVTYEGFTDTFEVTFTEHSPVPDDAIPSAITDTTDIITETGADEIKLVVTETVPKAAVMEKINENLGNMTAGIYLDINLIKVADGVETPITETSKPIEIKIELPDNLKRDAADGKIRAFNIIRIHDGIADIINADFDGTYLIFKTDRFSDYAIAYIDLGYGDVNGDGKINAKDVLAIRKHIVRADPGTYHNAAADVNADGKVNAKDVLKIRKYIVDKTSGVLGQA